MDLHHLRCVVAIAEHGSFTAAAGALHVSQPALSYAIARLEDELGTPVFDRTPTGARLTAAGDALLGHARRAISEVEAAAAAVTAVSDVVTGELRVVGLRTMLIETGTLIAAFHASYPAVRLVVDEPTGDAGVIERVRDARCDLGLMRTMSVPDDLVATPAGVQEIVAAFPVGMGPDERTIDYSTLARFPLIAPMSGTAIRALHDGGFTDAGVAPEIVTECQNPNTALELVRGGVGATLTARSFVDVADTSGIAVVSIGPTRRIELSAVTRRAASPAATACIELLDGGAV